MKLDNNHWRLEDYRQRMTDGDWREILLEGKDRLTYHGYIRQLAAKKLGSGVVEIYKLP